MRWIKVTPIKDNNRVIVMVSRVKAFEEFEGHSRVIWKDKLGAGLIRHPLEVEETLDEILVALEETP